MLADLPGHARAPNSQREEPSAAEHVVQQQYDAYNRHDLEAFVAAHAPDVRVYRYPDSLVLDGRAALRERFGRLFATAPRFMRPWRNGLHPMDPALRCEVTPTWARRSHAASPRRWKVSKRKLPRIVWGVFRRQRFRRVSGSGSDETLNRAGRRGSRPSLPRSGKTGRGWGRRRAGSR
jgi:SnoaL-like domain